MKLNITEIVKRFVEELDGRYRTYINDEAIEQMLVRLIVLAQKDYPHHEIANSAYLAGCVVFEKLLEHALRASGNGHHVAQNLAAKFLKKNQYAATFATIEDIQNMPYDSESPIKKGETVYKVNSAPDDLYKDGTPGITYGSCRNSKGTFTYIVEFKERNLFINAPAHILGALAQIGDEYISKIKPSL